MNEFTGKTGNTVGREVEGCELLETESKLGRNLGDQIARQIAFLNIILLVKRRLILSGWLCKTKLLYPKLTTFVCLPSEARIRK